MSYTAEISRSNPSCFLFVVDRSASMEEPFADGQTRKCDGVAEALNRLLYELAIKCAKEEGIRNYYDVGVIGYGAAVQSAFAVRFGLAASILRGWIDAHPHAYPPSVVHVSDGESTDGDPTLAMHAVTQMFTEDGNVLLFNVHISSDPRAKALKFPSSAAELPDANAHMLFTNASFLTPSMSESARQMGLEVTNEAKAFVLNADLALLVKALDIGTRASNPLR